MPTRVLLEGPAIEPLLAQVRDEYGSKVRIISADKVRSGGVGGFFAKQHYELSVEVPDESAEDRTDMARQTRTPTENGRPTLEQLVERAEAQDRMDEPARTVGRPGRPHGLGSDESRQAAFGDTGAAFAELMAGLDVGGHDTGPAGSAGATATRPSPRAKAPAPATSREETPTVRPFRPATAAETPVNAPSSPAAGGFAVAKPATFPAAKPVSPAAKPISPALKPLSPAARPVSPAAPAIAAAQAAAAKVAAAQAAAAKAAAAAVAAPTSPAGPPAKPLGALPNLAERIGGLSLSEIEIDEPESSADDEDFGMEHAATPVSPTSAVPHAVAPPAPPRMADNEPVIHNLMSVGMPEAMARKISGGDTYAGVLSVLAARPSAPAIPDGPGEILVLAGDVNLGVPIAKQLLDQIGAGENHLLLAAPSTAGTGLHSSRLISTPEAAESRVEKLHSADHPWVVVMDAPVGGTDPLWVNDMCDAIGATAVWSIVDATRKTADTARHLRTLGEVEALVVHGVELTSDPASVLGLDLPIYSLDGKPATPHAWAAMLCARIAADVMPVAAAPRRVSRTVRQ
ncbi:hypothetical protein ACIA5C_26650 [Actinoplanes sp. NPDC051343]|uniref:hypothetical protein n=1 Tax=Actinoplanes sp. NPDC051343 TaxID=3363906 RepID=UPI003796B6D4